MARVVAVFDDLLLGSNVLGMLRAAGHEARLSGAQVELEVGPVGRERVDDPLEVVGERHDVCAI